MRTPPPRSKHASTFTAALIHLTHMHTACRVRPGRAAPAAGSTAQQQQRLGTQQLQPGRDPLLTCCCCHHYQQHQQLLWSGQLQRAPRTTPGVVPCSAATAGASSPGEVDDAADLLAWSASEAAPAAAPPAPPAPANTAPRNIERRRRRQAATPAATQPPTTPRPAAPGPSAAAAAATDDGYDAAQQRVRAVLAAADVTAPEAAAQALPDDVDSLVIALQLLATSPRPGGNQAAQRQYTAAVQRLAAVVVDKFRQQLLLLGEAAVAAADRSGRERVIHHGSDGQQQWQQQAQDQEQRHLTAALGGLPPTRLAATVFALGVLRIYDRQLMPALEAASLQVLLGQNQQQQARQDSAAVTPQAFFKANQLGQLVQGLIYLDHAPSSQWQAAFREAALTQLGFMRGPQLASLAVWIRRHVLPQPLASAAGGAGASTSLAAAAAAQPPLLPGLPAAVAAAAAAAAPAAVELDAAWVAAYLAAAGRQATGLRAPQLVEVLQAAAGLYCQDAQDAAAGARLGSSSMFAGLPLQLPAAGDVAALARRRPRAAGQNSSTPDSPQWLPPLLAAFQQQLPDLKLAHLAAALPALAQLTACPWPASQPLLASLLLQTRLLLPGCAGDDLVAAVRALAALAGPAALAAQPEWCDAALARLHAVLPTLSPASLAGAVQALAAMRTQPYRAWTYALAQRLRVDAAAMDAPQLLAVLAGLAELGVVLDPEVLSLCVRGARRWMGTLGAPELRGLVTSLRTMYPKVLPGRSVQLLVEEAERRRAFLELQQQNADLQSLSRRR